MPCIVYSNSNIVIFLSYVSFIFKYYITSFIFCNPLKYYQIDIILLSSNYSDMSLWSSFKLIQFKIFPFASYCSIRLRVLSSVLYLLQFNHKTHLGDHDKNWFQSYVYIISSLHIFSCTYNFDSWSWCESIQIRIFLHDHDILFLSVIVIINIRSILSTGYFCLSY
jgi:hypothetical protein